MIRLIIKARSYDDYDDNCDYDGDDEVEYDDDGGGGVDARPSHVRSRKSRVQFRLV